MRMHIQGESDYPRKLLGNLKRIVNKSNMIYLIMENSRLLLMFDKLDFYDADPKKEICLEEYITYV